MKVAAHASYCCGIDGFLPAFSFLTCFEETSMGWGAGLLLGPPLLQRCVFIDGVDWARYCDDFTDQVHLGFRWRSKALYRDRSARRLAPFTTRKERQPAFIVAIVGETRTYLKSKFVRVCLESAKLDFCFYINIRKKEKEKRHDLDHHRTV